MEGSHVRTPEAREAQRRRSAERILGVFDWRRKASCMLLREQGLTFGAREDIAVLVRVVVRFRRHAPPLIVVMISIRGCSERSITIHRVLQLRCELEGWIKDEIPIAAVPTEGRRR